MGICYSQQQQWSAYNRSLRERRQARKKPKFSSVIYEQKSIYQSSFASNVQNSFRQDLHKTISELVCQNQEVEFGSVVEMSQTQLQNLQRALEKMSVTGKPHDLNEPITLCNIKTKNFMHTHKIKLPDCSKNHEVSCCPYNSNHIIEYDIWKFIKAEIKEESPELPPNTEVFYIYHPFTQRFLSLFKGHICCSEDKMEWFVTSFGPRRNGGFIKIWRTEGQLCMGDTKGLLQNHRKLNICENKHVSHLWEINILQVQ